MERKKIVKNTGAGVDWGCGIPLRESHVLSKWRELVSAPSGKSGDLLSEVCDRLQSRLSGAQEKFNENLAREFEICATDPFRDFDPEGGLIDYLFILYHLEQFRHRNPHAGWELANHFEFSPPPDGHELGYDAAGSILYLIWACAWDDLSVLMAERSNIKDVDDAIYLTEGIANIAAIKLLAFANRYVPFERNLPDQKSSIVPRDIALMGEAVSSKVLNRQMGALPWTTIEQALESSVSVYSSGSKEYSERQHRHTWAAYSGLCGINASVSDLGGKIRGASLKGGGKDTFGSFSEGAAIDTPLRDGKSITEVTDLLVSKLTREILNRDMDILDQAPENLDGKRVGASRTAASSSDKANFSTAGLSAQRSGDHQSVVVAPNAKNALALTGETISGGRGHRLEPFAKLASPLPLPLLPSGRQLKAAISSLIIEMPNAEGALVDILDDLMLRVTVGSKTLRLPPTLLVGPPGIGKTRLARRLAEVLDLKFAPYSLGGVSDNRDLEGTATGWASATPSWPLREISRLESGGPLCFLDEIDKAKGGGTNGDPISTMLAWIEPSTSMACRDPVLGTPIDLSHISWIMAANNLAAVPAPLRNRLKIIHMEEPTAGSFDAVMRGIISDIAAELNCDSRMLPELEGVDFNWLRNQWGRHRNPRMLRKLVKRVLAKASDRLPVLIH